MLWDRWYGTCDKEKIKRNNIVVSDTETDLKTQSCAERHFLAKWTHKNDKEKKLLIV